jgi:hypothetical protein
VTLRGPRCPSKDGICVLECALKCVVKCVLKCYQTVIVLGFETDTCDAQGEQVSFFFKKKMCLIKDELCKCGLKWVLKCVLENVSWNVSLKCVGEQVGETKGWDHVTEEAVLAACRKFVGQTLQVLPIVYMYCVCMYYVHTCYVLIKPDHKSRPRRCVCFVFLRPKKCASRVRTNYILHPRRCVCFTSC